MPFNFPSFGLKLSRDFVEKGSIKKAYQSPCKLTKCYSKKCVLFKRLLIHLILIILFLNTSALHLNIQFGETIYIFIHICQFLIYSHTFFFESSTEIAFVIRHAQNDKVIFRACVLYSKLNFPVKLRKTCMLQPFNQIFEGLRFF